MVEFEMFLMIVIIFTLLCVIGWLQGYIRISRNYKEALNNMALASRTMAVILRKYPEDIEFVIEELERLGKVSV